MTVVILSCKTLCLTQLFASRQGVKIRMNELYRCICVGLPYQGAIWRAYASNCVYIFKVQRIIVKFIIIRFLLWNKCIVVGKVEGIRSLDVVSRWLVLLCSGGGSGRRYDMIPRCVYMGSRLTGSDSVFLSRMDGERVLSRCSSLGSYLGRLRYRKIHIGYKRVAGKVTIWWFYHCVCSMGTSRTLMVSVVEITLDITCTLLPECNIIKGLNVISNIRHNLNLIRCSGIYTSITSRVDYNLSRCDPAPEFTLVSGYLMAPLLTVYWETPP